jgi:hypothetical protein
LYSDLSAVAKQTLPVVSGVDGNKYYRVNYSIKMTMESDVLKFELVVGSRSYGEATTRYI